VESVAWITERKDVLSSFFLLLALAAYGRYARGFSARWYAACLGLWALAAMAKPSAVVFPALLLILDFWPLGRLGRGLPEGSPSAKRLLGEKVLPLALAAGLAALTLWTQHRAGALIATTFSPQETGGPLAAVLTERPLWAAVEQPLKAYAFYLGKLVWPVGLGVVGTPASWPGFDFAGVALAAAVLAGLSALAWATARTRPYVAAGWLWYLAALFPSSGIVAAGSQWLADRFTYLPHLGLIVALTWAAADLAAGSRHGRTILGAVAAFLFAGLLCLTTLQLGRWRTAEGLLVHSAEVSPQNWLARFLLGRERASAGNLAGAAEQFREVTRIIPQYADGHYNLAMALAAQGRTAEAVPHFQDALRLRPEESEVHFNFAVALARAGQTGEAVRHFREAVRYRPGDFPAAFNLGYYQYLEGDLRGAVEAFSHALELRPDSASALYNLAAACEGLGDSAVAADLLRESLRLRPDLLTAPEERGFLCPRPPRRGLERSAEGRLPPGPRPSPVQRP
jgi:tetratricopeptide (TPR) repeat protein